MKVRWKRPYFFIFLNDYFKLVQFGAASCFGIKLVPNQSELGLTLKVKRYCSGLTGPFCSSRLQVCDLQTMRQDHTLLSEHGTCPGSRPSSRDRNGRSADSRGSEPPEVLQKVFGIFTNWSKVRVNVTELLQLKVAADKTHFWPPEKGAKKQKQKTHQTSENESSGTASFPTSPNRTFQLSQLSSEKKQSGETLTHSIFLFFSGNPAGHGEGGADGASINKYIYNNIPARGQAADPARPGIYSSAIMTPARGRGGGAGEGGGGAAEGRGGSRGRSRGGVGRGRGHDIIISQWAWLVAGGIIKY